MASSYWAAYGDLLLATSFCCIKGDIMAMSCCMFIKGLYKRGVVTLEGKLLLWDIIANWDMGLTIIIGVIVAVSVGDCITL